MMTLPSVYPSPPIAPFPEQHTRHPVHCLFLGALRRPPSTLHHSTLLPLYRFLFFCDIIRRRLFAARHSRAILNPRRFHDIPLCPTHAHSLLHRQDRNYHEAIKCYRMALRIDEGNLQLLRDLSYLLVQVRDFTDFIETRRQILQARPGTPINWMSFAVANFLAKKYDMVGRVYERPRGGGDFSRGKGAEKGVARHQRRTHPTSTAHLTKRKDRSDPFSSFGRRFYLFYLMI